MKLSAGLFFPALALSLLSCCGRVQSENPAAISVPASSNGTTVTAAKPVPSNGTKDPAAITVAASSNETNHTSPTPTVKPGATVNNTGNGTVPTVPSLVPSNASTPTTIVKTTAISTTNFTTTTANATTAKNPTTKASPISSKSPSVTVTSKIPSSGNATAETATAKAPANLSRSSGFDVGSFIGGIVLTLGILILGYIGCRTYHAKRGVQYRTIDEHDAII